MGVILFCYLGRKVFLTVVRVKINNDHERGSSAYNTP